MKTLRQRIRKQGIRVHWHSCRQEVKSLPISAQTLFKNSGVPFDILNAELLNEGWLYNDEKLWDVLRDDLYRKIDPESGIEYPWNDSWTEEDFKYYYGG